MKVLVVDDHPLYRDGLVNLLNSDSYFSVVGQAGTVQEAISQAKRLQPDLVLMDFSLPDGTGSEASAAILKDQPECKIVFLTMYDANEKLFDAIRSGAKGYLLKNASAKELVNSLKLVENGEAPISGKLTMRILEQLTQRDASPNALTRIHEILSQREIEVLRELACGASNDEIATKLFLSVNTVKHHVHNILAKLGVESRRDAIQYARQAGLM